MLSCHHAEFWSTPMCRSNTFTYRALYLDYAFVSVASCVMWALILFQQLRGSSTDRMLFNDGLVYYMLMFLCGVSQQRCPVTSSTAIAEGALNRRWVGLR